MNKLLILLFLLPCLIFAQSKENSPYTRYGIGEILDPAIASFRSMGYTSVANSDRFHVNLTNPATLTSLSSAAFEIGASARKSSLTEGENKSSFWSGNIDYLTIGFPLKNPINQAYEIKKKPYVLGMAFSLQRMSKINYAIFSLDSLDEVGRFTRNYSGNGGTYKIQWGNAIKYKNFSFGLNLGYLFGNLRSTKEVEFIDQIYAFDNFFDKNVGLRGLAVGTGLMYDMSFNEKEAKENPSIPLKILKFGLIYNPPTNLNTRSEELSFTRQVTGGGSVVNIDTIISNAVEIKGKAKLGSEFGLGVMFLNGEKSSIAADLKFGQWSSYFNEANGEVKGTLKNTMRTSLGGYFRPNYKSYKSFWQRSYYKYGAYYAQDPRVVLGKQISSYAFTAGVGLPFVYQRKVAFADIGLEYGKLGSGTAITENFFKINFGFTFSDDEWFIKRKYN